MNNREKRIKEILLSDNPNFDHPIYGVVEVFAYDKNEGFDCVTMGERRVYCQPEDLIEFSKSKWVIK